MSNYLICSHHRPSHLGFMRTSENRFQNNVTRWRFPSSHVEFNLKTSLIRTFPCSAIATWKLSNFSFSIVFVQVTESSSPNGSPSYKALSLYLSNIICKSCCRLRGIESVKGIRIEFNVYHMETLISCQMRMVQNWITKKSPKRLASKSLLMISSLY